MAAVVVAAWLGRRGAAGGAPAPARAGELEALYAAARTMASSADLVATAEQSLAIACRVARTDAGAVFRLDAAAGTLTMIAQHGATPGELVWLRVRPLEGSRFAEALGAGRMQVLDLTASAGLGPEAPEALRLAGRRTQVALPIPAADGPWGVMALMANERRDFTPAEAKLLEAVAAEIGLAVTRASLVAEARDKGRRLETLVRLARTLTATLALDEVLRRVVGAAVEIFGASQSGLWLLDRDGEGLWLEAAAGAAPGSGRLNFRVGEGLVGTIAAQRAPLVVADLAADRRLRNVDRVRVEGLSSFAGVPITLGDRLLGTVTIATIGRRQFGEEEIELLQSLADHAAVAIDNARRFEEERTRRAQLAALLDINKKIGAAESTEALLRAIAEEAARLLDVDNAGFRLVEGDELVLAGLAGTAAQTMLRPRLKRGESFSGRVVQEGRTIVADVAAVPDLIPEHRAADERLGYTAFLGVPLRAGDRIIGALTLRARRPFVARDRELAEAFADQAAVALEHARLYREAQRQAERMGALADVERLLSETLDPDVVAQRIADSVRVLLAAQASALYRLEPVSQNLEAIAVSGDVGPAFGRIVLPPGTGVSGLALRERRPVVTPDLMADPAIALTPEARARLEQAPFRAALAVPLRVHDRLIGALGIGDRPGRVFGAEDIRLAEAFAGQAAVALENARLFALEHARRGQIEILAEIEREFAAELDLDRLLRLVVDRASRLFGADGAIYLVQGERTLVPSAWSERAPFDRKLSFGEGVTGACAAERRALLVNDYPASPHAREPDVSHGVRRMLAHPLVLRDSLLGVVTLSRTGGEAPPFTPDDLAVLESFAMQAAIAIENARLHEEATRRRREAEALAGLAQRLTESLEVSAVGERIVESVASLLRISAAGLRLLQPDGSLVAVAWGGPAGRGFPPGHVWPAATGLTAPVIAEGRAVWSADVLHDDRVRLDDETRAWVASYGYRAMLAVPLQAKGRIIGVLVVADESTRGFSAEEIALAQAFADQAALALENARLYAEVQERLRETTTLLAVGQVLSQPTSTEERMRQVAREVAQAFGADTAGAYVLDPEGRAMFPVAGYHVPEAVRSFFARRGIVVQQVAFLREAWATGRAVWSADVQHDARVDPDWARLFPTHSIAFAPTLVRGEARGGLFLLWRRTGRPLQPAEVRLIEGVAAQVGLALESAELGRQREQRLRETETLLAVSRTLSSTLDFDRLSRQLMRELARAIGADSVGVWMADERGEWLTPTIGYHVPPRWLPTIRRLRVSLVEHAFYADAARTRRAVFARDTRLDPRIPPFVLEAAPHRSQLFVPIIAKERMIGGFIAIWWEQERELAPGDLALMEAIANQAGVALENLHLFEQNRRQVEELSVLHELSRAVTGQLDRQALLDALRLQLPRVLAVDKFGVLLVDDKAGEVEAVGLTSVVLDTGRSLRTADYAAECARRGLALPEAGRPSHWLGVPLVAGNAVLGVLTVSRRDGAFTDAEERVAASIADLAALALRSARLYGERTRAYGELAAAQDHLVRTEKLRALGEMASGVAHDFNNLLAAILGRTQLLLRRIEDPRLRQWLQVIERSAMDGAQTVRRLQEFARVRRDEPLVPVDLNEIVRGALEITQARWREESLRRGIPIEVQTRLEPVPHVGGDPSELREAMTNLILNAIDAMPDGGTLTLTTATVDGQVEVTVSDTGTGIPNAIREKIFDPFFTTKGPQGTGLGLSLTYGILSRHGARITVASEEGRGATFRMTFPLLAAPTAPTPATAAPGPPAGAMRCLVVDDEEAVGAVIGDVLESLGHQAVVVTDGAEAIDRFRAQPFDAVFTDLAMPGVSGWQVARAVKDAAPAVPVFVVTGFGVSLSADERRAHGVEAIFSKPLKIEDVMDAMAQVARRRGRSDGREEPR